MPAPTSNQGLVLPVSSDLNAVPTHLNAYNAGVEGRLVQRYDNSVDRGVRNPSPAEGELSYLRSDDRYEWWNGSSWQTIFFPGPWQTYTPTWGAVTGAAPTIGNGSLLGRYQQIGKTVTFRAQINMGSTSTYGTGQWTIGLPVPASSTTLLQTIIPGHMWDVSATNGYVLIGYVNVASPGSVTMEVQDGAAGTDSLAQGTPVSFANGDLVTVAGSYEAA